jgi:hypothetical protein
MGANDRRAESAQSDFTVFQAEEFIPTAMEPIYVARISYALSPEP